jgi:hypothetical protein
MTGQEGRVEGACGGADEQVGDNATFLQRLEHADLDGAQTPPA